MPCDMAGPDACRFGPPMATIFCTFVGASWTIFLIGPEPPDIVFNFDAYEEDEFVTDEELDFELDDTNLTVAICVCLSLGLLACIFDTISLARLNFSSRSLNFLYLYNK